MSGFVPERYTNENMTRKKVVELKSLFDALDTDKSGYVSAKELLEGLQAYRLDQKNKEIFEILEKDYLSDSPNDVENFEQFLKSYEEGSLNSRDDLQLKEIFDMLDSEGRGYITEKDLKDVYKDFREDVDESQIKQMVVMLDRNNNSHLDFDDFKEIVRDNKQM